MGIFEKIKNMFVEEVAEDDVKVEQIKKEVTHVSIDSPNSKNNDIIAEELSYKASFESTKEFNKPVFFDDNDFKDLKIAEELPKQEAIVEIKNEVKWEEKKDTYKTAEKIEEEKKLFKPTPIISPVYGILDKNYHKEDIVSKTETKTDFVNDESSIDKVRNKAYGTLEDELENTLFGNNSILFKKESNTSVPQIEEVNAEDITNLTEDISKELDELILKKQKHFDGHEDLKRSKRHEHIEKSSKTIDDDDLLNFIDSTLYKEGEDNSDD